ncbi:hypothetical protein HU200_056333 [Digitaria exilis]|uniref:Uncharacterized protein n=1 Tax=Digitaria exilis TaxID=1010633 RepID=A0A835E3R1_9POAL|nr:hypothetical protein HU200_056333 [Digitaria exilis]
MVQDTKATIVSLQETKLDDIDRNIVAEILGPNFTYNYVVLPAVGTRGGILLAADVDYFQTSLVDRGSHSVTARVCSMSGCEWYITTVYGPQDDNGKLMFLGELRWTRQCVSDKWLIISDFNMILYASDEQ